MPSRTPNIPNVWENKIFSKTFQNAIQREATARMEAEKKQAQSKSANSKATKAEKIASEQKTMSLTSSKKQNSAVAAEDNTMTTSHFSAEKTLKGKTVLPEVSLASEISRDQDVGPDEVNDKADERSIVSDTASDRNAQLEIKKAAEAQKAHQYKLDTKLMALMVEKKDDDHSAQAQTQHTVAAEVHQPPKSSYKESDASSTAAHELSPGASSSSSTEFLFFPLERAASGIKPLPNSIEAKELEQAAKNKLKKEKRAIAEAKLAVLEAKLDEFEARLCARQAKITERHANLCYRRAIIAEAEENLQALESALEANIDKHQERERGIKTRERRAKQEEIRIQIIESELKKRETKITREFENFEKRKKLLDEKEAILLMLNGIKTENVEICETKDHGSYSDSFSARKPQQMMFRTFNEERVNFHAISPTSPPPDHVVKLEQPIMRRHKDQKIIWKRHSSYEDEMVLKSNPTKIPLIQSGTLPRQNSKSTMGFWL